VLTPGVVAIPVLITNALCGLPAALSVTCRVACSGPTTDGVNSTLIEQLAFGASVAVHVFVCAKSPAFVPVTEIVLTHTGNFGI
jgi:hypothetical protein